MYTAPQGTHSQRDQRAQLFRGTRSLKFTNEEQHLIRNAERSHGYDPVQETEAGLAGLVVRFIVTLIGAALLNDYRP